MSTRWPLARTLRVPVRLEADAATLSATVSDADDVASALLELTRSGIAVTEFALGQPSLDEVFLALTGRRTTVDHALEKEAA